MDVFSRKIASDLPAFDAAMASYCEAARNADKSFLYTKHGVLGAQFLRLGLKKHLNRTWAVMKNWQQLRGWKPRPPVPWSVLEALFLISSHLALTAANPVRIYEWLVFFGGGLLEWTSKRCCARATYLP